MTSGFQAAPNVGVTWASIPGKLYLAGEYGVLTPHNPALILAVDRYLHVRILFSPTFERGVIQSGSHYWEYRRTSTGKISTLSLSPDQLDHWRYVISAIETVERLLAEWQLPRVEYHIQIASELQAESGQKYGFGSSGAVTAGVILALLRFYGQQPRTPQTLFKLAAIAQTQIHATGSYGDLAASCSGGIVYYQALDKDWLAQQIQSGVSIQALLDQPWPDLVLETVPKPDEVDFLFGWTGTPASTDRLVQALLDQLPSHPAPYEAFAKEAKQAVDAMDQALQQTDVVALCQQVQRYDSLLRELARVYQLDIVTPALERLIQEATTCGLAAKSSGAGGGDCGIAVGATEQVKAVQAPLAATWSAAGIEPLELAIAPQLFRE